MKFRWEAAKPPTGGGIRWLFNGPKKIRVARRRALIAELNRTYGMNARQIANSIGVSYDTVRRDLQMIRGNSITVPSKINYMRIGQIDDPAPPPYPSVPPLVAIRIEQDREKEQQRWYGKRARHIAEEIGSRRAGKGEKVYPCW